jgi:hypothetical protein
MAVRKIATNLPSDLLQEATRLTGLNQTQTLIEGLRELIASRKRQKLLSLRGKLHIDFDARKARQRKRLA